MKNIGQHFVMTKLTGDPSICLMDAARYLGVTTKSIQVHHRASVHPEKVARYVLARSDGSTSSAPSTDSALAPNPATSLLEPASTGGKRQSLLDSAASSHSPFKPPSKGKKRRFQIDGQHGMVVARITMMVACMVEEPKVVRLVVEVVQCTFQCMGMWLLEYQSTWTSGCIGGWQG